MTITKRLAIIHAFLRSSGRDYRESDAVFAVACSCDQDFVSVLRSYDPFQERSRCSLDPLAFEVVS